MNKMFKWLFNKRRKFTTAVITAAGSSTRMDGVDKQLVELEGIPCLVRTLLAFEENEYIDEIIVVTKEEKLNEIADLVETYTIKKAKKIIIGGENRLKSSYNGVLQASKKAKLIAVQDGARPLVSQREITDTVKLASKTGAAICAVPVRDTVKIVKNGVIESTPDRATLWAAQTPQVFDADVLKAALTSAVEDGAEITDDSSAVERMGVKVSICEGDGDNIKLTTKNDIEIITALLKEKGARL